jgi:hypothetical protein
MLGGEQIETANKIKYLGVMLGRQKRMVRREEIKIK